MPYGKYGKYPPPEGKVYDRAGYEELIRINNEFPKTTLLNILFYLAFVYIVILLVVGFFGNVNRDWWMPVPFFALAFSSVYIKRYDKYRKMLIAHMENIKKTEDERNLQRKNMVNLTVGDGSPIIIGSHLENSFNRVQSANISNEIKDKLRQLNTEVAEASKSINSSSKAHLEEKTKSLNEVIAKGEGERTWWLINANSVKEVAKVIGAVGVPIIKTVDALISLFN
jgi:hypothetical protein